MVDIVFFKGHSEYSVFDLWLEEISSALAGKGFVLRIIDLTDSSSIKESLNRAFDIPALCYMGFNGQGSEFGLPPYNAYENVNKPYIGICVDHPIAHHDRLLEAQLFYAFIDRSHVVYATEVYGGSSYGFLPHAGSEARNIFSDRPFDVVFLGSYNSPHERKRTWQGMPKSMCNIIEACIEIYRTDPTQSYSALRDHFFEHYQVTPSKRLLQQMYFPLSEVDLFLRSESRYRILKDLDECGIAVDLFGAGWELESWKMHRLHGPISYQDSLDVMAQTKCLLDVNPNFQSALHECMLSGMLNGAVVFTDKSYIYDHAFVNRESYFAFQSQEPYWGVTK